MAKILSFPRSAYGPIRIERRYKHRIAIWITDEIAPEEARWLAQRPVTRAGSYRALQGFNDHAARNQTKHVFHIGGPRLLRRFLREIEPLVRKERIAVAVDRKIVRVALNLVA